MATTASLPARGISLAKGPIAILGLLAIAYGVLALIFGGNAFALHIPHGRVGDGHFLGLLTNGWTDLLFCAAGLLLVLGAPAHALAKSDAMLVALVLGAAAVIAVIRGNGVFGIFAANGVTEIVWGGMAVLLALLAMLPRVQRDFAARRPSDPAPRGSAGPSVAPRDEPLR
jgi:hypothetical protein